MKSYTFISINTLIPTYSLSKQSLYLQNYLRFDIAHLSENKARDQRSQSEQTLENATCNALERHAHSDTELRNPGGSCQTNFHPMQLQWPFLRRRAVFLSTRFFIYLFFSFLKKGKNV